MLKKKYENMRLRYCDGKDKYFPHTRIKDVEFFFFIRQLAKHCLKDG